MVDNRHSGGKLVEVSTKTCAHCQRQVIMNPNRVRDRKWCFKCDKYICDDPACSIECVPIDKIFEDALEARVKERPLILPERFTK